MKRLLLVPAVLLSLAACHQGERAATRSTVEKDGVRTTIEVTDAWCRPTPNGAQTGACYFTVKSSHAERLTAVATPAAAMAQLHAVSMEGGVMKMAEMPGGLALPAGQAVRLAPGGSHLMLMGLTGPLVDGQRVELTLGFQSAPALRVLAPVQQPPATQAPSH